MGVDLTVMGEQGSARRRMTRWSTYAEPSRGVYKKLIVRNGRLAGAILLGDTSIAPALLQAFDRGALLPENRAELLFPLAAEDASQSVVDLPDDAQICNCNGVSKGAIIAAVKSGCRSLKSLCDATRAGTGCGSCKPQAQELLEFAAGDLVVDRPVNSLLRARRSRSRKPELIAAIKERKLRSVSAVFAALAGGKDDPAQQSRVWPRCSKPSGRDEYEDERDARFINDRVHANIQKDRTFSVVPRIYGGVTSPDELRRIADVAEKYNVRMVKITGGQRIDLLGVQQRRPAERLARSRDAFGTRVHEGFPHVQDLRRVGVLPLRRRRQRGARHRDREAISGHRVPAQGEARRRPAARATAPKRRPRTSAPSRSKAASGRSTSAARPDRRCGKAIC